MNYHYRVTTVGGNVFFLCVGHFRNVARYITYVQTQKINDGVLAEKVHCILC